MLFRTDATKDTIVGHLLVLEVDYCDSISYKIRPSRYAELVLDVFEEVHDIKLTALDMEDGFREEYDAFAATFLEMCLDYGIAGIELFHTTEHPIDAAQLVH